MTQADKDICVKIYKQMRIVSDARKKVEGFGKVKNIFKLAALRQELAAEMAKLTAMEEEEKALHAKENSERFSGEIKRRREQHV